MESKSETRTRQTATESKKVKELEEKNTSLKLSVETLEQERDFYFAKLRDIEILCTDQSLRNNQVVKAVQTILFATEEYDIAGLIKEAGERDPIAGKELDQADDVSKVDLELSEEAGRDSVDKNEETCAQTAVEQQPELKQEGETETAEIQKENIGPEVVAFNKSPLLPCEDCGVNFLEDNGLDLLKTSPFALHNNT